MSIHLCAIFATHHAVASNNRGDTANGSNVATLPKIIWKGQSHSTVSAESIRFALRRRMVEAGLGCNRIYDEETRQNRWKDENFANWKKGSKEETFTDDDLLGYMMAVAGKDENDESSSKQRRSRLAVTRAVSLTPWTADSSFNVASIGATASAQKKGKNPVPYNAEMHATRYQYGIELTPESLDVKTRAAEALQLLCKLGQVAGNHARFLFDFSPESAIFRISHDPAPRILYGFRPTPDEEVGMAPVIRKVKSGDVKASELIVGGEVVDTLTEADRKVLAGASIHDGVMAACDEMCERLAGLFGRTKK